MEFGGAKGKKKSATVVQLRERAKRLGIEGRSKMRKAELQAAIEKKQKAKKAKMAIK
jgi:transcription termination factor Rho